MTLAMTSPHRLRLSRAKGSRLPPEAVNVARPIRYGNPFHVRRGDCTGSSSPGICWQVWEPSGLVIDHYETAAAAHSAAVQMYRRDVLDALDPTAFLQWRAALRGRDLACWCPLDLPCHADVLLETMNDHA